MGRSVRGQLQTLELTSKKKKRKKRQNYIFPDREEMEFFCRKVSPRPRERSEQARAEEESSANGAANFSSLLDKKTSSFLEWRKFWKLRFKFD